MPAWFTINYRLAPAYHFPAPVEDVESAIRYVQSHAGEYKVDLERIAITGESAGGHLVSFVGARDGAGLKLRAVTQQSRNVALSKVEMSHDGTHDVPASGAALTAPVRDAKAILR